jgi:PAS domain S-box-containing protein
MAVAGEDSAGEIERLQRCLNDLVDVLALPGTWSGDDPSEIAGTLLEVLPAILHLDLVYVRLSEAVATAPVEMAHVVESVPLPEGAPAIGELISRWLGDDPTDWLRPVRCPPHAGGLTLLPQRLGPGGELGLIVAGSRRADFPALSDRLLFGVATSQATIGLQEARRRIETAEARRVEDVLRASESHIRQILETIPGLVHFMRPNGEEELFNWRFLDYFGVTSDEIKAWQHNGVVHPDDVRRMMDVRARSIPAGLPFDVEHRCRRADGVYRWFHSRTRPVRDPSGTITGWYSLMTDIDDLKRAEEELRRQEAFLTEAQRLSSTGSFSWRPATDEIIWSDQLYRIFEFDRDGPVMLDRIQSRVHPDDLGLFRDVVGRAYQAGVDFELEHRLLMSDQSVKYLYVLAHATRDRDGALEYVGAVQDVTERRSSEEALARARSELARVARITSLGALTASIAHEVNQPLSGIITNASTCLRMLAADPPNVAGAVETARRTIRDGRRASDVITRLRGLFTRKEGVIEPVDLAEVAREVIALSMSELRRGGVTVHTELADNLPAIHGDRVQLQQVILNLIMNASDAMNGVSDRPRELVVTTDRDEGGGVRLSVRDTGTGFEPEAADQLFEPFYSTKSGGMGIGLSISRSIIERHHGRLWAGPNQGPGATFTFSIPSQPSVSADR